MIMVLLRNHQRSDDEMREENGGGAGTIYIAMYVAFVDLRDDCCSLLELVTFFNTVYYLSR